MTPTETTSAPRENVKRIPLQALVEVESFGHVVTVLLGELVPLFLLDSLQAARGNEAALWIQRTADWHHEGQTAKRGEKKNPIITVSAEYHQSGPLRPRPLQSQSFSG